ncbi:hypothetical protein ACFY1A_48255 [Streptomyces sp. NPDC001520]|uniref:hypothetical protein n=1 Tax=Streptomyces sp. NPDC001520 TaxID=3364581 RepID=UPI0036A1AFB3
MRAPIVCAGTWRAVIETAGGRCQCAGGLCGSKHSKSGLQCDVGTDRARLIAAPLDLTLPPTAAAAVPVADLRAWCPKCHREAAARQRANQREMRRQSAEPAPSLFDL